MEPLTALKNPPEPLSAFPAHRRRHLKSDTYSTLFRFLSHCPQSGGDNNELGSNREVWESADGITVTESEMLPFSRDVSCAKVINVTESVKDDRMETNEVDRGNKIIKKPVLEQGRAGNELEQATEVCGDAHGTPNMKLSANGDTSCWKVMNVVESVQENSMETEEFNGVKRINKELGQENNFEIVNSLEKTNLESCVVSLTRMDESQGFETVNSLEVANPESCVVSLTTMDDSQNSLVGSLGETETSKSPVLYVKQELKTSVMESNELNQENSLIKFSLENSPLCVAVEKEIEEGEISGDLVMDDELIDFLSEEEQISAPIVRREQKTNQNEKVTSEVENKYDKVFGITVQQVGKGVESNVRESNVSEIMVREIVSYQNLVDSATTYKGGISTDKDAGVERKRKRSPLTQEKRAKKKKKERIKRAEKDRQLGVRRLKIQPMVKPKTINYCRHYLEGRCREGDKCKFSHDITPLTKSKPCRHLARGRCMNEGKCEYDHQLSKYPCNIFVSKGICNKRNCLFSHEVQAREGSSSGVNASNSEAKSSSLSRVTNPEKTMSLQNSNQKFDSKTVSSAVSSFKIAEQRKAEISLGDAASSPKGISKLLFGKSPLGSESKLVQARISSKVDGDVQNNLAVVNNNTNNMVSDLNGTLKVPGFNEPKGLSFLSFGEYPTHNTSPSKQAENLKLTNNTSGKKSETPKRPHSMPPRGINFLSIGKSSPVNNSSNMATPSAGNSAASSSREGEIGQNLTGQLSKGASSSVLKARLSNGTSSAQKAFQSTLAFAAKYESVIISQC